MNKEKKLRIALIIAVAAAFVSGIVFTGALGRNRLEKGVDTKNSSLITRFPKGVLTAREAYGLALKKALNISNKSVLTGLVCRSVSLDGRNINKTLNLYGFPVKAGTWEFTFYTPEKIFFKGFGNKSLHSFRVLVENNGIHVVPAGAERIPSINSLPSVSERLVDSPEAVKIGLKNGGEEYLKQYSDTIIMVHLISNYSLKYMKHPLMNSGAPWVWEVNFGSCFSAAEQHCFIDASTGKVLKVERRGLESHS